MTRSGLRAISAAGILDRVRYEVIPTPSVAEAVLGFVPKAVSVAVTASPVKGLEPTIALAETLARSGYHAIPHLSARLVVDEAHLKDLVSRLSEAGVVDVFVPAGDADPPAGIFASSLEVLTLLAALGRPFSRVGITGYPESHPMIDDDVTIQAMWDKRRYADYIVSNLCFNPGTIRTWVTRVRARGVTLPLFLGLAGPVDRTKLLTMATKIGVGESARFVSKHLSFLARMGAPGGYSPGRILERAGPFLAEPGALVEGLHLFTFNQVRETERWRQQVLERAGRDPAGV